MADVDLDVMNLTTVDLSAVDLANVNLMDQLALNLVYLSAFKSVGPPKLSPLESAADSVVNFA